MVSGDVCYGDCDCMCGCDCHCGGRSHSMQWQFGPGSRLERGQKSLVIMARVYIIMHGVFACTCSEQKHVAFFV